MKQLHCERRAALCFEVCGPGADLSLSCHGVAWLRSVQVWSMAEACNAHKTQASKQAAQVGVFPCSMFFTSNQVPALELGQRRFAVQEAGDLLVYMDDEYFGRLFDICTDRAVHEAL